MKCASPGDCKIDGRGKAHCERGGMAPPRPKREQPQPEQMQECKPDETACDSEARFAFQCQQNGTWGDAWQCFGPGWCRHVEKEHRKRCVGWPTFAHFDGCEDGCEFNYSSCGGVSTFFMNDLSGVANDFHVECLRALLGAVVR
jgi:hypothetical protein